MVSASFPPRIGGDASQLRPGPGTLCAMVRRVVTAPAGGVMYDLFILSDRTASSVAVMLVGRNSIGEATLRYTMLLR